MLAFTLGFGPAIFPAYDPEPKTAISQAAKSVSDTSARVVAVRGKETAPPPRTWRNWVHDIFMLGPVDISVSRQPDRSELEKLRRRANSNRAPGRMSAITSGY